MSSPRAATAGFGLALALVLAGCGEPPSDLPQATADRLQAGVLAVAQAASQEQYDVASAALVDVRAALESAVDTGAVSAARYRAIDEALLRTDAELVVALEAQQAAEQPVDEPVDPGKEGNGSDEETDNSGKGDGGNKND